MNIEQHTNYARHVGASSDTIAWLNKRVPSTADTVEVEHVIDYLVSDKAPKRLDRATWEQMVEQSEKWTKALIKKGEHIKESPDDTKTVLDFNDGFKVVQLIGKRAYEREGYLMRHCVASYHGKDVEVYSLRDEKNMPHCTIERDKQIKGRGNGDIHPKYIDYVVRFLEHLGMEVSDSEMKHLGYVNVSTLAEIDGINVPDDLFRDAYLPITQRDKITKRDGSPSHHMALWPLFGLFDDEMRLQWRVENSILESGSFGDGSQLAGGDGSQLAGGSRSQLAGGERSQLAGGDRSQLAGGYLSQLAGGYLSQLAGGYLSQLAGGDGSQLAGGSRSQLFANGANAIAVGGHGAKYRGAVGAWLVIPEYADNRDIAHVHTVKIDGEKYSPDKWYTVEDGQIIETTIDSYAKY